MEPILTTKELKQLNSSYDKIEKCADDILYNWTRVQEEELARAGFTRADLIANDLDDIPPPGELTFIGIDCDGIIFSSQEWRSNGYEEIQVCLPLDMLVKGNV